jgi:aspartate/methionine/tyrosine aminotransferase
VEEKFQKRLGPGCGRSGKPIQSNTKIIYINTPHNPTGVLMSARVFQQVVALAASWGIILFSDEVHRELEHHPPVRLPAACEA